MSLRVIRWVSLAGGLLLSACSSLPAPEARDPARTLLDVPFFAQEQYMCGPATLAMALAYRGVDIEPQQLSPALYLEERHGTLAVELKAEARSRGYLAIELDASIDDLLAELAAGNPVIVMQNLGFTWLPKWHFAVAIGYDLDADALILHSGTRRDYIVDRQLFQRTWQRAAQWALVITPLAEPPVTADAADLLAAGSDFEQTGQLELAAQIYTIVAERWPEHSLALFGLANVRYAQGDYRAARELLVRRVQLEPGRWETWNNLAYTELALQCVTSAQAAATCAAQFAPDPEQVADLLSEVDAAQTADNVPVECPAIPVCPIPANN